MTKTAFIAIVGKPNVGKSSLLNRMLGQKIAIVSSKPQTTRTKIMGVLTEGETQLVFTDTPGFHRPHNKLGEKMNAAVGDTVGGVDACLFLTEPKGELNEQELQLLQMFKKQNMPVVLAVNKTDMIKDKKELLDRIVYLTSFYDFQAVVPVSAQCGDHVDELKAELEKLAFESPHFFPDDTLTDQPERVIAAEMIREKILRFMDKEVPHGVAVEIEQMRERPGKALLDVSAVIYCDRESHKRMIIGKNGAMLKRISTYARMDMERFFQIKINLKTWVKVKEGWRNREAVIRNFGLED